MSNPYCSACHRNRPASDFRDGDMICYRHYIENEPKHIPVPLNSRPYKIYSIGKTFSENAERQFRASHGLPMSKEYKMSSGLMNQYQKMCPKCGLARPKSNFPKGSDFCYRHIPHLARMGHIRALAEIRGEPIPRRQKTREELDRALRRRRREKQKELDAAGQPDRRLVKRGAKKE